MSSSDETRIMSLSEDGEQTLLASWLDAFNILWTHPPNEAMCTPQYRRKRARLGVKPGVPDVLIFTPPPRNPAVRGVAIELKRRFGKSRPTVHQTRWLEDLGACEWLTSVAYGAEEAISWLERLGYGNAATKV